MALQITNKPANTINWRFAGAVVGSACFWSGVAAWVAFLLKVPG